MTVIAWDGKVLAADKRTSHYGSNFTTSKLHSMPSRGLMWGACGNTALCHEMTSWITAGRDPEKLPAKFSEGNCSVLVIEKVGDAKPLILFYEGSALPTIVEEDYFAIGSGSDFALGAMYAGASASRAVRSAIHHSNSCGNGFSTLEMGDFA